MIKIKPVDGERIHASQSKQVWGISKEFVLVEYASENPEPEMYRILHEGSVSTLGYSAQTTNTLLLERFGGDSKWELYSPKAHRDLFPSLGEWFKALHQLDAAAPATLSEIHALKLIASESNFSWLKKYEQLPEGQNLEKNIWRMRERIRKMPRCILHNDFCYKNTIVNRHENMCIMYDYDKAGYGFAAQDVRDVMERATAREYALFIEGYGAPDPGELKLAGLMDMIETLEAATHYSTIPNWAGEAICFLKTGKLNELMDELC